jgi:hypothetical protein
LGFHVYCLEKHGVKKNSGKFHKEQDFLRRVRYSRTLQFGSNTDKVLPGDFTGDGKSDIAFFRASSGFWYVLRSNDFSYYAFPWGQVGDIPVPADYDGDGVFDAAVFRPSAATWFISRSSQGPQFVGFGLATDLLVPNTYVRN